jgi:acetyl-CoA C-acetyltransferase
MNFDSAGFLQRAVTRGLGFDLSKVHLNGGAIALGHPVGRSIAFLATKAIYELHRTIR